MRARTHLQLHNTRWAIERVRRWSDRLVGIGPLGIGLDGLLGWIPGVGALYSIAAGGLLLYYGLRSRAAPEVLFQVAVLIAANTASNFIPTAGGLVDMVFTAHKWSADLLLKHMEQTRYVEGDRDLAQTSPQFLDLMARIRSGEETRRVVFLS